MNWKSTLALVLLAGAAGAWFFKGDAWGPEVGIKPANPEPPKSEGVATLDGLKVDDIAAVRVEFPYGSPLVLTKGDAKTPWKLDGNWPPRNTEALELVELLGSLRTRFHAMPIPTAESGGLDLAKFGLALDQKPITVKVTTSQADAKPIVLTFGEPQLPEGESGFTRPAYVRVGEAGEALKLGPDVMPVVRRSAEAYRRRQLFTDVERVKFGGPTPAALTLPGEDTETLTVQLPPARLLGFMAPEIAPTFAPLGFAAFAANEVRPSFTLARSGKMPEAGAATKGGEPGVTPDRLADVWRLTAPVASNAEPNRLRPVLAAVAELWVDQFVNVEVNNETAKAMLALSSPLDSPFAAASVEFAKAVIDSTPIERRMGFGVADPTVVVKRSGTDKPLAVRFGGVARFTEREEKVEIPGAPAGMQMPNRRVRTEFRYAQVVGESQFFIVAADKFADLFARTEDLTDQRVARFEAKEVQSLRITRDGGQPITLTLKKGDPKADKAEDKLDSWTVQTAGGTVPAEITRVNDLINRLVALRADSPDNREYPVTLANELLSIIVTAHDVRAEGEPDAPARVIHLSFGQPNIVNRSLPVWVATATKGEKQPRVSLVDDLAGNPQDSWLGSWIAPDTFSAMLARPGVAYRAPKLFETPKDSLETITASGFTLKKDNGEWKLTAPLVSEADPAGATKLAFTLENLTAAEFLSEAPTGPELVTFGLEKPKQTIILKFKESKEDKESKEPKAGKERKLEIGVARPGKPEVFARLDGGVVFTLPSVTVEPFTAGAVALLPLRMWTVPGDKFLSAEVTKFGEVAKDSFTITKDGANAKLTGPFTATGAVVNARPLTVAFSNLTAVKYHALTVTAPNEFGFDKPLLSVKITYLGKKPPADVEVSVSQTVIVGNLTGDGLGRYAKLDAPDAPVFVIAPGFVAAAQTPPLELLDRTLMSFSPTAFTGIARTMGKDEFEIGQGAVVGWDVLKPAKNRADQQVVEELAEALGGLKAERIAAYGKKDDLFKKYGLEPAVAVVAVTFGDKGETKTLRIGNPADPARPDGDRFVTVESASPDIAVGVLSAASATKLLAPGVAFRDRTLAKFVDVDKVVLERGDRKVTFTKVGGMWKLTEPLAAPAESAELDALLADLAKLRADSWVAEKGKDLSAYGLDKPEAKWTLTDGDKTVLVLLIGKKTPDGRVHVTTDKGGLVGLLDPLQSARLLAEYRQRRPWEVDALQIESIELTKGEAKFTLAHPGAVWVDAGKPAELMDPKVVNELLGTLGSLTAERYAVDKDADPVLFGLEKPGASYTVVAKGGAKAILELGGVVGGTDGKQRYARVVNKDRTDVFVLSATDTARLMRDRAAYVVKK